MKFRRKVNKKIKIISFASFYVFVIYFEDMILLRMVGCPSLLFNRINFNDDTINFSFPELIYANGFDQI